MKYQVFMVSDAEEDILEIYRYASRNDSIQRAENLYQKLEETCLSLTEFPNRGHIPPELERIGVFNFFRDALQTL